MLGASCGAGAVLVAAPAASASPPAVSQARKDDFLAPMAVSALATLQAYMRTGDTPTLSQYRSLRVAIAAEVANRLELDPASMIDAWNAADLPHQAALMAAFTQLGVPYRRNTSKPGIGFDCSGLTTYAWGVAGVGLTRQSGAQIRAAAPRTLDTAMAGDLIYYPGHVMLYLGVEKAIVHAPYSGTSVQVDNIPKHRSVRLGDPAA
jgi:cell wall-associated NlpC family hydrolase